MKLSETKALLTLKLIIEVNRLKFSVFEISSKSISLLKMILISVGLPYSSEEKKFCYCCSSL